jgi:hypothetical protein
LGSLGIGPRGMESNTKVCREVGVLSAIIPTIYGLLSMVSVEFICGSIELLPLITE